MGGSLSIRHQGVCVAAGIGLHPLDPCGPGQPGRPTLHLHPVHQLLPAASRGCGLHHGMFLEADQRKGSPGSALQPIGWERRGLERDMRISGVIREDEFCAGRYREGVSWLLKKSNEGSILMHFVLK